MKRVLIFIVCIFFSISSRSEYIVNVLSEDTGTDNGTVEVIANGRTGPYTVSIISIVSGTDQIIEDGATSVIFSSLSAGSHVAQITNEHECIVELPFTVSTCPLFVSLYLEGAYDQATGNMTTELDTRGMLPGQTPTGSLSTPTPAGQPYHMAPWNYPGDEGANWTDADYEKYNETAVDWILMTVLEKDIAPPVTIFQAAGILDQNGSFHYTCPPDLRSIVGGVNTTEEFHVRIEHRNHMGIMTPAPIHFLSETDDIEIDFRDNDSYKDATSFGQIEIEQGVWGMFAGDADQSDIPSYDINGNDKSKWFNSNGVFDYYIQADMNLDADVNGNDKIYWDNNNGLSSRVPKN